MLWNGLHRKSKIAAGSRLVSLGGIGAVAALATGMGPAAAQSGSLEEIIVSAQKREERMQDIPATISAFSAEKLDSRGISSVVDLQHTTPGLTFGKSSAWTNFYMRGLGNAFNTPSAQSPVAFYLDDVYIADAGALLFGLDTIEQIEILKGPQGTLYGRNAVAGAINIRTKAPSKEAEMIGKVSFGNFNAQKYFGYVNGGTDLVQANLSVTREVRDGVYESVVPGIPDQAETDDLVLRTKVRFTPNEVVDIILGADYMEMTGLASGVRQPIPYLPSEGVVPTGVALGGVMPTEPWTTSSGADPTDNRKNQGLSLKGRFALDGFDIVSISAYREFKQRASVDLDSVDPTITEFMFNAFHDQFSQELQFLSTDSERLSWVFGLFYLHDDAGLAPIAFDQFATALPTMGVLININSKMRTNSYAAFGEVTYDLTDSLSVVGGLRYSVDKLKHYDARQVVTNASGAVTITDIDASGSDASFYSLTPKLSLSYERPEGLYYVTASQGYSSGLFNITSIAPSAALDPAINPQKINSVEIGAKWSLMSDQVRFNLAGFYYDVADLQLQTVAGGGLTQFENADGEVKGLDAEVEWLVVPSFSIRAAFEILETEYTSYPEANVWVPNTTQGVAPCFLPSPPAAPGTVQRGSTPFDAACKALVDLTGQPMMRSPEFTSTVGFNWDLPISESWGTLTLTGDWYHSADYRTTSNGTMVSPEYDKINSSMTFASPDDRWNVAVWGKNLTEAEYYVNGAETNYVRAVQYGDPRTYGVTLTYNWGG